MSWTELSPPVRPCSLLTPPMHFSALNLSHINRIPALSSKISISAEIQIVFFFRSFFLDLFHGDTKIGMVVALFLLWLIVERAFVTFLQSHWFSVWQAKMWRQLWADYKLWENTGLYSQWPTMTPTQAITSSICAFYKMSAKGAARSRMVGGTRWPTPGVTLSTAYNFWINIHDKRVDFHSILKWTLMEGRL